MAKQGIHTPLFRGVIFIFVLLVPLLLKAQLPPGWDFTPTFISHIIAVPLTADPNINGDPLSPGDHIGVFYDDEGVLKCGGAIQWDGAMNVAVTAFGDDPYEDGKQGFYENDAFVWKFYRWADTQEFDADATYQVGCPGCTHWDGFWHPEGISALESIESVTIVPGDANCDGVVNVLDIIHVVNYIMELNPTPFCFQNADVNGDLAINVLDIIGIVNIIMGG